MADVPWTEIARFLPQAACATASGAVVVFAFLWSATRFLPGRRIEERSSDARVVRLELFWSVLTVLVVAVAVCVAEFLPAPLLRAEFPPPAVFAREVVVFVVTYDFAYYWWHRSMHTRALYRTVHRPHHLSRHPTVLSALSFHPFESLSTMALFVVVAVLTRMHLYTLLACEALKLGITGINHCGVAFLPRGWERTPVLGLATTPLVHATHHRRFACNFGFYTTAWDRLFGTFDGTLADEFWDGVRRRAAAVASSS
jgi:sterol desaturase/sphingolipid hydroxylase (fatty acid hydroxylase superfamily)